MTCISPLVIYPTSSEKSIVASSGRFCSRAAFTYMESTRREVAYRIDCLLHTPPPSAVVGQTQPWPQYVCVPLFMALGTLCPCSKYLEQATTLGGLSFELSCGRPSKVYIPMIPNIVGLTCVTESAAVSPKRQATQFSNMQYLSPCKTIWHVVVVLSLIWTSRDAAPCEALLANTAGANPSSTRSSPFRILLRGRFNRASSSMPSPSTFTRLPLSICTTTPSRWL